MHMLESIRHVWRNKYLMSACNVSYTELSYKNKKDMLSTWWSSFLQDEWT